MDTQNVSAQLYFKQLPHENLSYNCDDSSYPNLSTCVDNYKTDTQIEDAFQEQLNLSEIYKSPDIFNKVKQQFMDETMEAENIPKDEYQSPQNEAKQIFTQLPVKARSLPASSTDILYKSIKEGFGNISNNNLWIIIVCCILAICGIVMF